MPPFQPNQIRKCAGVRDREETGSKKNVRGVIPTRISEAPGKDSKRTVAPRLGTEAVSPFITDFILGFRIGSSWPHPDEDTIFRERIDRY